MNSYDLVIRGGNVADGKGGPLYEADIAIKEGVIVEVGRVPERGSEEIDARGQMVTPGFVDIHTHYDGQSTWDSQLTPSCWHGVTTVVMGNCGVGFAPVRPRDHECLIELMEGVEDIPGSALHEGLKWEWESFAEYLDALDRREHDIDICAQLPHGALRVYVMGERAVKLEPATQDDIAEMRRLAAEAMRAGAIGFSTSRTVNHRTVKGDPTPSLRAAEDELTGIAMGLKDAGSGVIELISDFDTPDVETEFARIRRIVQQSGRPLSLSLGQRNSDPDGWRFLLGLIEDASKSGLKIKAQVAPRAISMLFGLQGSLNPFSAHPSFRALGDKPLSDRVAIMRTVDFRDRLLSESPEPKLAGLARRLMAFERIFPLGDPPDYEPPQDRSIASLARSQGRQPAEVAYDFLLENDGRGFLFAPFANYAEFNLDACREMMLHPDAVIGLADGGAHVGIISDSNYPTYLLTHWGRDRSSGRLDPGFLVKRHTADTARTVGLLDRGMIAAGMKADINVIDFDKLRLEAPVMAFDLPAGGKRLLQRAQGYTATIVSGAVVYRNGEATGELPGKLVRGTQPVPAVQN
ncbi:MAG: N-acyl-D-amino-acid deacylase family protein [Blastocatellia bacterium]